MILQPWLPVCRCQCLFFLKGDRPAITCKIDDIPNREGSESLWALFKKGYDAVAVGGAARNGSGFGLH